MVDALTPFLLAPGLNKRKPRLGEGRGPEEVWFPPAFGIGVVPGSEGGGGGRSLSAGCLAGRGGMGGLDKSISVSTSSGKGKLRLSLYPISPRFVGNGPACGLAIDLSWLATTV